jgi:hypothetical protein
MKTPVPQDQQFEERLRTIERRLDALNEASPLRSATIDFPGELLVRDSDGSEVFRVGATAGQVGVIIRRPDGSLAFRVGVLTGDPSPNATVRVQDRLGNLLFEDDETTGQGLSRPYLQVPAVGVANLAAKVESTTSSSFAELWRLYFPKQHPKIDVTVGTYISGGGVTGEVDLWDVNAGARVAGPFAFSGTASTILNGSLVGAHMSGQVLAVRGRVTGGGGNVGAIVFQASTRG